VLLIIITGALGLFLLRNQGLKALLTLRSRETAFEPTPDNILKNLFTPIGGFFLLIPGFLTDILGLLILLPPTRIIIIGYIFSKLTPVRRGKEDYQQKDDWIEGEYKKDK
jgi:UPF0716 protein FxsA